MGPPYCVTVATLRTSTSSPEAGGGRAAIAARTLRTDRWWLPPLATAVGLLAWIALRDRPRVLQKDYFVGDVPLPDAVLLAVPLRRLRRPSRRTSARSCRTCGWLSRRRADPAVPAAVPADLLLLPQGLLPGVLALAAGLRGRRAAHEVHRRDPLPAASCQNLHRYFFYAAVLDLADQHLRRDATRSATRTAGSASGLGTLSCWSTSSLLWAYTAVAATPAGTSSAAGSSTSPSTRCATGSGAWCRQAQRPPHAARLADAGQPRGHRLLHRAWSPSGAIDDLALHQLRGVVE